MQDSSWVVIKMLGNISSEVSVQDSFYTGDSNI